MITDPQSVKFCNEEIRPLADSIARNFAVMQTILASWAAKGMAATIIDDSSVIADGSAADGRTQITGADVCALIALATTLVGMGTGQNSAIPTVLKIAVNPGP